MCDTNHHVMCISDTGYMILRIIEDEIMRPIEKERLANLCRTQVIYQHSRSLLPPLDRNLRDQPL